MAQFTAGDPPVYEMIRSVIEDYHHDLMDVSIRVLRASILRGPKPVKVSKATPSDIADGFDLVVVYDGRVFGGLSDGVARAFIDHALSGWVGIQKKGRNGQIRWVYSRKQPVEIHLDVVERHQANMPEWREIAERFKQLKLNLTCGDETNTVDLR